MGWKDESGFKDEYELFENLLRLQKNHKLLACRGQANMVWSLEPTLGRVLAHTSDYKTRLGKEVTLLIEFSTRAGIHLDTIEKRLLDNRTVASLGVLRHHGVPTRVLDWTLSPWVALFFASVEHFETDAALWWFDLEVFEKKVDERWARYDMKKDPRTRQVSLMNAFQPDAPPWISMLYYPLPFPRIESQQGCLTVAGRLGCDHADAIDDVLYEGTFGRLIIPGELKSKVLEGLRAMNIHSRSLDYPAADIVGNKLTEELKGQSTHSAG